jgi:hypothetical protein
MMIERVDSSNQEMIFIKFEDSDEFVQVNTMDSAWKEILDRGPDTLEYIETWDPEKEERAAARAKAADIDDLKLM